MSESPRAEAERPFPAPSRNGAGAAALAPRERIAALCDRGSVEAIGSPARPERGGEDGVVAAAAQVDGRPLICFAQDGRVAGGSLGEAHAATICHALELAASARVPVVAFVESAGARVQDGVVSLNGYARVFRRIVALSGVVPQISVLTGTSAGGGCYCAALTDFTVMTRGAGMFLTGPKVVEEVMGEVVGPEQLGGHRVHRATGVCQAVAEDELDAVRLTRELLSYLPGRVGESPPLSVPVAAGAGDPSATVPVEPAKVYDVRDVVAGLADRDSTLELAPRWGRSMFTGFARMEGRPVGVIANQPRHRGGAIDVDAAQKGARFVALCDSFGLPLIVLVDTPGFLPGSKQEEAGIIRHGATLLRAFSAARVPKLTVILRRAFGGGYITMNSKDLGADLSFAWPGAAIGVMGAEQAVGIVDRADIATAANPASRRRELASAYADRQTALAAARAGAIDEVVPAVESRQRLCGALSLLAGRRNPVAA